MSGKKFDRLEFIFIDTVDFKDTSGTCDHCGKSIRYGIIFKKLKTNEKIIVGRRCADNMWRRY